MNKDLQADVLRRRKKLIELFDQAPIKRAYGMKLSYDQSGGAVFEMPYNPQLDHFQGGIHGAVIAALLDNAGWFTAATYYDHWVATVEFQARLLEAVAEVDLRSRGWIVKAGRRFAVSGMEVRTRRGLLVAVGSGTFAVTSAPMEARVNSRKGSRSTGAPRTGVKRPRRAKDRFY